MDPDVIPRWGYLLIGLVLAAVLATFLNVLVLGPMGMSEAFEVVTVIGLMTPVVIYVGIWFDERRQSYRDRSRAHVIGDVAFLIVGAVLGSTIVVVALLDTGLGRLVREILAMFAGLTAGWLLFYWRNVDIYRGD